LSHGTIRRVVRNGGLSRRVALVARADGGSVKLATVHRFAAVPYPRVDGAMAGGDKPILMPCLSVPELAAMMDRLARWRDFDPG
jgi:hypothetical protein